MKIAICDDEAFFRSDLMKLLDSYSQDNGQTFSYYEYDNGASLLLSDTAFDLIFMDYQMKDINGIDTVQALRKRNDNTKVVFISSFKDVVFESLKVQTYRFILKPIEKEKLYEALDSFIAEYKSENVLLLKNSDNSVDRVFEKSVIYIEAANFHCRIRTFNNTYECKKNISKLEKELKSDFFFKTHRSYIVNLAYIVKYSETEIYLENNEKALLAKSNYTIFQKAYMDYLKRVNISYMEL